MRPLVGDAVPDAPLRVLPAFSSQLRPDGRRRIFAAGDAAASHDPLSSNGIPHALGSGIQAARAVADEMFGAGRLRAGYERSLFADYARYLKTRWANYGMERRWPDARFWKSRTMAIQLNPDMLLVAHGGRGCAEHSTILSATAVRRLLDLARSPITAHRMVAEARHHAPHLPDERIILAVQELVADNVVSALGPQGMRRSLSDA